MSTEPLDSNLKAEEKLIAIDSNVIVTANQRFGTAGLELSARIQARQNTINAFVVVIFAFIGVFFKFAYDVGPEKFVVYNNYDLDIDFRGRNVGDVLGDIKKDASDIADSFKDDKELGEYFRVASKMIIEECNFLHSGGDEVSERGNIIGEISEMIYQKVDKKSGVNDIKDKIRNISRNSDYIIKKTIRRNSLMLAYVSLVIPIIGFVFSCWVGFQAVKIQHLHQYLSSLESSFQQLPSWHDIQNTDGWFKKSQPWRLVNNLAFCIVLMLTCLPASWIAYKNSNAHAMWIISIAIIFIAIMILVLFLSKNEKLSHRISLCSIIAVLLGGLIVYPEIRRLLNMDVVDLMSALCIVFAFFGISLFLKMEYLHISIWESLANVGIMHKRGKPKDKV